MTRNRCNVFCNAVLAIVGLAAFNTVAAESSRVMLLSDIALHPQRSAPATALSLNESTLSSQLLARVQTIHVRVSQSVKKNDRLLTLDCADYNLKMKMADARHKAAESRWDLAKNQLARAEKLIVKELASQELLDNRRVESTARQAEFDEADVARQRARLDVERCNIAAPFDGVVISRLVGEGELASVGTPLMELVDVQGVELSASVNFEDARLLDQAQEFFFDYGNRLPVKLRNLGAAIDATTRNREARFEFTDGAPLPGTSGKLVWRDPRPQVPADYVVARDGALGVFIEEGGVAKFVAVPSAAPGRPVTVDFPQETGVVTKGLAGLQNGDAL